MTRTGKVWVGVLAAIVAIFLLLHAPFVRNALRDYAERRVTGVTGGRFEIGNLSYRLWEGRFQLEDLLFEPDPEEIPVRVRAERANVALSFALGVSVTLHEPVIIVLQTEEEEEPAEEEPSRITSLIPGFLGDVRLRDGTLRVLEPGGEVMLSLSDLDLTLADRGLSYDGSLAAGSGALSLDELVLDFDRLTAELDVESGGIQIQRSRVEMGSSFAVARGTIPSVSPFEAALTAEYHLEPELLHSLQESFQEDAERRASGVLTGTADVRIDAGTFRVTGKVASSAIEWGEIGPFRLDGRYEVDERALVLPSVELHGYDGALRIEARLGLEEPTQQRFDVDVAGLRLGEILAELSETEVLPASRVEGQAELALSGFDFETADGRGRFELTPVPQAEGLPLGGRIAITLDSGDLAFEASELSVPSTVLSAEGTIQNLEALETRFEGRVTDAARLRETLEALGVSSPLELGGSLAMKGEARMLLTDSSTLAVDATFEGGEMRIGGKPVSISGSVQYGDRRLQIRNLKVEQANGDNAPTRPPPPSNSPTQRNEAQEGDGGWRQAPAGPALQSGGGEQPFRIQTEIDALDIAPFASEYGIPAGGVARGRVSVTTTADGPDLEADLSIEPFTLLDALEGEAVVRLRKEGQTVLVDELRASFDEASFTVTGEFRLDTRAADLRVEGGELPLSSIPAIQESLPGLDGTVTDLTVDIQGPITQPSGEASLTLSDPSFRGAPLPPLRITVQSDGEEAMVRVLLPEGEDLLTARVRLEGSYPVNAVVHLSRLPVQPLVEGLAPDEADPYLDLEGTAEISFPAADPGELVYEAEVQELVGNFRGITAGTTVPFSVAGDREALAIQNLHLIGTETAVEVNGRIPLTAESAFDLTARGQVSLEILEAFVADAEASGLLTLDLRVRGERSSPQLEGGARIADASIRFGDVAIEELTADLDSREGMLVLDRLDARFLDGGFQASGSLPLPGMSPDETARLEFTAVHLDFSTLLGEDVSADLDLLMSASGTIVLPRYDLESLEGSGEILKVRAWLRGLQVESDEPATWTLDGGRFRLPGLRLVGGGTDLSVEAAASLPGELEWSAAVAGTVDMALLTPFLGGEIAMSGATRLDVSARSEEGGPRVQGTGALVDIGLVMQEPPIVVSDLRGDLHFEGNRILVNDVAGELSGGKLLATGLVEIGETLELDFEASAEGVRLNYPEGLRSELSAAIRFQDEGEEYLLSGNVVLERALYERDISLESQLISALEQEAAALVAEESFTQRVRLDLDVRTEEDLRIDNNLAEMQASANLNVGGTLAEPVVSGVVVGEEGGMFFLGRNTFRVEDARVTLTGYPLEPPEINLTARSQISNTDVILELRGTMDNLQTDLRAPDEPSLTRADVGALVLTGRTLGEVRGQEGRVVGEQVASYLGGSLAQLAAAGLGEVLPFTQVSIEPRLVGTETDPGARFTIGQALAEDLFLTYSVALDDAENQFWILEYQLPHRLTVRGIRDDENEITGSISQRLLFDLRARPRPLALREGPELAAVDFAGPIPIPEEPLRRRIDLSPGDQYDYWKASEDAEDIQQVLRERGYLGAVVDFDTFPANGTAQEGQEGRLGLVFEIEAGKRIDLVWEGDPVDKALRGWVRQNWDGRVPETFLVTDLANEVTWRLRADRFYTAEVTTRVTESEEAREVAFLVEKGPRGSRVVIDIEGNASLSDDELQAVLPSPSSPQFFESVFSRPDEVEESLRLYYAQNGFLETQIGDIETEFREETGELWVRIPVGEGEPALVSAILLEGVDALPEEQIRQEFRLREGERFRLPDFVHDRSIIGTLYRREGFPEVRVRSSVERADGAARIHYQVSEGPRAVVGEIHISGNYATPERFIRRELTFEPGEPLRISALTESQSRLYELGVFRSVSVRAQELQPDEQVADVFVEVVERADVDFDYGVRYDTENRLELLGDVTFPNVLGRARSIGLTARVNPNDNLVRALFESPYFLRYRLHTDVFAGRELETTDFDRTQSWIFTFQQMREIREELNLQWSYSFRRINTTGLVGGGPFDFDVTVHRAFLTAALIQDTRDSFAQPTRGRFWNATVQLAPSQLGSDINLAKFFGQLFLYRPVGRAVWASSYRLGIAEAIGEQRLLRTDRFQAGGAGTVRGFEEDMLGPADPITQTVIGGEGVAIFNQEIRFPIWRWFGGVAFLDAGNIFLEASEFNPFDLRYSAGAGLRIALPIGGLFRIDWARILDPEAGEKTSRFYFSLGHAF